MRPNKRIKKRLLKKLVKFHVGLHHYAKAMAWSKVRPGDLLHDCDGFNHRVESVLMFYHYVDSVSAGYTRATHGTKCAKPRRRLRRFVADWEALRDDGRTFCGCSGPQKPLSRRQIEANFLWWDTEEGRAKLQLWGGPLEGLERLEEKLTILRGGGHICDEDGCLLEALRGG